MNQFYPTRALHHRAKTFLVLFLLFISGLPVLAQVDTLPHVDSLPPRMTAFRPTSASTGTIVVISGQHLGSVTSVHFGGIQSPSVTIFSDTLIGAAVGSGASGVVTVANPYGVDSLPGFVFLQRDTTAAPKIISFTPASAKKGATVNILGHHFLGATSVHFGGTPASSFVISGDTMIFAVVGSGASGYVSVAGPGGADSMAGFTFIPTDTVPVQRPHIISFRPDSARRGATVFIFGTHFNGLTSVRFGGTAAASFTVVDDSLVQAVVGNGSSGLVAVAGLGGTDSLDGFTFIPTDTVPVQRPHIISFRPDSARTGTTVFIFGTHFTGLTSVHFGGTTAASFTVVDDSLVQAVVGNGSSGLVAVAGPNGADSLGGFTFIPTDTVPVQRPKIFVFNPTSGSRGTVVSISGMYFSNAARVTFGGVQADTFRIFSDSLILANVGAGASGYVAVFTPNGADSLGGFTFVSNDTIPQQRPRIILFRPDTATTGTTVSVFGAHFTGLTSVAFGGVPAASFTVVNDSLVQAVVGNGASGYVSVAGPGGSDSLFGFTFIPASHVSITVYPNPAVNEVAVKHPRVAGSSLVEIVDMHGNVVKTITIAPNAGPVTPVPLRGLNTGVYKIIWSDGRKMASETIFKL